MNTLVNARPRAGQPQRLFVSLWLQSPGQASDWRDVHWCMGPALALEGMPTERPVPVLVDTATMTFLRSRSVSYRGTMKPEPPAGERPVITHLVVANSVDTTATYGAPIDLPLAEFLRRYLAERRVHTTDVADDMQALSV